MAGLEIFLPLCSDLIKECKQLKTDLICSMDMEGGPGKPTIGSSMSTMQEDATIQHIQSTFKSAYQQVRKHEASCQASFAARRHS